MLTAVDSFTGGLDVINDGVQGMIGGDVEAKTQTGDESASSGGTTRAEPREGEEIDGRKK